MVAAATSLAGRSLIGAVWSGVAKDGRIIVARTTLVVTVVVAGSVVICRKGCFGKFESCIVQRVVVNVVGMPRCVAVYGVR